MRVYRRPAGPSHCRLMIRHVLLTLLAGACAWPAAHAQPATPPNGNAPSIQVGPYEQVAMHPVREAPASVVPRNEARIAAEVGGRVLRWTVDTGGQVARGALLVEIDPVDFRLSRDQARAAVEGTQARLKLAETQLQRARQLVAEGFFSQEALNSRETEVQLLRTELAAQRAQLATAERSLGKTRIHAPFAASVKERLAQAGEFVAAGTPLYVLTQTDAPEVSAQIPLADVDSLRRSTELQFVSPAGTTPLTLARVAGTVTAPARTVEVRLAPRRPVVVGSSGRLLWRDPRPHVPASLLVQRDGRLGVFVAEAGRARFVPVPEAQEGRAAPLELPPGTPLVTSGHAGLRDGQALPAAR